MQIGDVMNPVETIEPDATVQQAAERMRDLDVGALPVCDGKRLLGMLTDRDIAIRAVAAGKPPSQTRLKDAMTPQIAYVFADDDLERAAQVMEQHKIRRLPVVDHEKKLVGIVAMADLARSVGDARKGQVLEQVSEPR